MQIFIDVEDASGNKYGDGPITTAAAWTSTRRLDAAGTFSFSMPASDPRAAQLAQKRIVRAWSADENGVVERGMGIIDDISVQPSPKKETMLVISGDDMLRELVYRTVGDLELFDRRMFAATYLALVTYTSSTILSLPAVVDLAPEPLNFLYVGYTETYTEISFALTTTVNSLVASLKVQYYNALSVAWESLSGMTNTTIVDGIPFAQSGSLSFDSPAGWGDLDGLYLIRIFCDDANLSTFELSAVNVHVLAPTPDALQKIMALAPPGWSLDASGAFTTEQDVYMQMQGDTDLAALVRLAEQTGEHFILGASGRRVRWLGSAQLSSGLRAIASAEPDDSTMAILALTRTTNSYDLGTRLYVYGGGVGSGRLTLADTDRPSPAGYELNRSESYMECIDAQAIYGRIDSIANFGDIAPTDISASAMRYAANSLFDRAYQLLRKRCQPQQTYSLSVIPSHFRLYPGQTIHVIYHEWQNDFHAVAIDTDLVVLETVEQIDADQGVLTVGLTVATVDYWPENDHRTIARAIGSVEIDRNIKLPQTGLNSTDVGVPTYIGISAGSVVAINRVVPVPDGIYGPVDHLKFQGGIVTAVNP